MAHTKKTIAGNVNNGSVNTFSYSGSFDVFKASEVEVELDNVALTFITGTINDSANPREYTVDFTNKTVHIGGANLVSTNSVVLQPVTDMGSPTPRATYQPGASITSADLNNNQLQLMRKALEYNEQKLSSRGGTMTGNLHMGENVDISFEGDTDNTYETTLTVADPTADRTITLPNVTGTVVTTGDTGTVATGMIANDAINADKIGDDVINSEHYAAGSIDLEHMSANSVDSDQYVNGSIDNEHYAAGSITSDKLSDATVITSSEQAAATINDTSFLTSAAADARFFNLASAEEIQSGETWTAADNKVATTAAIDARIIDLVDDVGGFVPIANETSFPNANPDVNNGAGTLVSVPLANNLTSNGSGVISISNGTVGNSTVTINGATASATFAQGFGIIVETTSTLNTYTFHRYVPKATEVTTVAGSIANVNTTAGSIGNVNNVGNNIANVNIVAGNNSNVTAVADNATNINAVAGNASNINSAVSNASNINSAVSNSSNINTVAGNISNVNTVGGISGNVTTVAGISGNVTTAANNGTDISTVAGSITNVNNVGGAIGNVASIAASLSNVNTVAGDISNVNTVAGNNTNINTVAGNNTNITTVANNNSNITAVAGDATDIGTVAGSIANVDTTAANIANVNSVGGAISNVNTVATNLTPINTAATYLNDFQALYLGTAASAPVNDGVGNAVTEGDLYFNTGNKQLQVYNGSVFTSIFDTALDFAKSATAAFNALYTASAGSNSIDLGGLAITGAAFSNEAVATNRVSLAKGSATYNLGGI